MIKQEGNQWVLFSKDGEKKLGTFDTKEEAQDQEDNVQVLRQRSVVDMIITKASLLKDGTMRFQATCSDTESDSREEQTTRSLFSDWMQRVEKAESVSFLPPPQIPFLGIAHYSEMDGLGEAGVIEKGYIDGNQFKVSGYFHNGAEHPCGPALFSAVQEERELVQKGETVEEPIRISAAWWDLGHAHGDFIFERKSLTDTCTMCDEGAPRTFLKGQLDHMAATRVPINPRTSLQLEEMSDNIKTRKDDASSMIGEELAEMLDKAHRTTTQKSEPALTSLSVEKPKKVERAFGGATTFDEAEKELEASKLEGQVWTNLDMFMTIVDNIMWYDDPNVDKAEAMKKAVSDFGDRISALKSEVADHLLLTSAVKIEGATGEIIMPKETSITEKGNEGQVIAPVDSLQTAVATALGDQSLDRAGKFAVIQPALDAFAEEVKGQVEATTAPDLGAELSKAFDPIAQKLDLLLSKIGAAQSAPVQQPVQRSYSPGPVSEPAMANTPSSLTKMIRKSVGIVEQ